MSRNAKMSALLFMNWKSTAVVSGVTILAGWLAKDTALYRPITGGAPSLSPTPRVTAAAADIQREADRLHARLQQGAGYRLPERNPFQFSVRPAPAPRASRRPAIVPPVLQPDAPALPTLGIALAGIAEDQDGEQIVRTAIISTPGDVLLLKEGEQIGDVYIVAKIEKATVELTRLADGSVVRLALKP